MILIMIDCRIAIAIFNNRQLSMSAKRVNFLFFFFFVFLHQFWFLHFQPLLQSKHIPKPNEKSINYKTKRTNTGVFIAGSYPLCRMKYRPIGQESYSHYCCNNSDKYRS